MISYLLNNRANEYCNQEIKTKIVYPLSLNKVKRHLRIDNSFVDDDDYLSTLIIVATNIAENFIEKDVAKTKTELRIEKFDGDCIEINDGNFLSVISVSDGNYDAIGTIDFITKKQNLFFIQWKESIASEPLHISYYSGYEENTTPEIIEQAILIKIADLYDSQRSDILWSGHTNQMVFESILNPYRQIRF